MDFIEVMNRALKGPSLRISEMVKISHETAKAKGWYDGQGQRNIPEALCLIHSEITEALEEYRQFPNKLHELSHIGDERKPVGFPSELADILIRVADLAGYLDINLEQAVKEKMAYNITREYRHGGKAC